MEKRVLIQGLAAIFLIRVGFALFPSFQVDMSAWIAWAYRLASLGPSNFYSDSVWTQYTPGFLYWLWIVGKIGFIHPLAIKIPAILADMVTGYLVWKVVAKSSKWQANLAYVAYVLNPIIIFDGSVWGQIDGILTMAMYGAGYLLLEKGKYYASYAMTALAILIKPQAVATLPILFILTIARHGPLRTIRACLITIAIVVVGYYPFYPSNPVLGLVDLMGKMGASYPFTSLYAFNVWAIIGMWQPDKLIWNGVSYFGWGVVGMTVAFGLLIIRYRGYLKACLEPYLMLAMACFIFYLFPTRVHERYLLPMFAFLITYVVSKKSKLLGLLVIVETIIYTLNLYLPYSAYEAVTNPIKSVMIETWIQIRIPWLAISQITIFAILWLFPTRNKSKESIPVQMSERDAIQHRRDEQ